MKTYLNKSKKIILDTRHEKKSNKASFTIFSLSNKKFYIKPFLDKAQENKLKLW